MTDPRVLTLWVAETETHLTLVVECPTCLALVRVDVVAAHNEWHKRPKPASTFFDQP